MTTSADRMFQERLQVALQDLADEVRPARLLDQTPERWPRPEQGRRGLLVAAAAVAALVVGIASAVWLRTDGPHLVEPVQRPPKIFHLSGLSAPAPGRATMAVVLTDSTPTPSGGPAYLVPATGGPVVALPSSAQASYAVLQRLSSDGRVVIRQNGGSVGAAFVLVDLASGRAQLLNDDALDLALSPDGSTAAEYTDGAVVLVDLGSGARHVLRRLANPLVAPLFGTGASGTETVIGSMGWSPDGSMLAMRDGSDTLVLNRHGELRTRLRGAAMVNGSQSWSPDGRGLLVYDGHGPTFSVRPVDGDTSTVLRAPTDAVRPLGWAGSRIVWLTGAAGAQRLVLADESAAHTETWMRFAVGAVSVESVTWSSSLTGTVRR